MNCEVLFAEARRGFHDDLLKSVLRIDENGIPSNADKHSKPSRRIAHGIVERLGGVDGGARLAGQSSGKMFEEHCCDFLDRTFLRLNHIRPGRWRIRKCIGAQYTIENFDQYEHLDALAAAAKGSPELAAALGMDYLIKPDVVVMRYPEKDDIINADVVLVDEHEARLTPLRIANNESPILHASVSCKWTVRSDRAQNARSEALNLVRNRKGRLPHVVVVTAEPTPSRIASIALGTGDIDCVYHFALPELSETVKDLGLDDAEDLLETMIHGKRLRDITDLPLDLAI